MHIYGPKLNKGNILEISQILFEGIDNAAQEISLAKNAFYASARHLYKYVILTNI